MRTVFVDANVFLRFFTRDDAGDQERAAVLFQKAASGNVLLVTGPPVLFEIAWTLRAAYRQTRETALKVLAAIAAAPGLRLLDADLVEESVALARKSGAEFADAYIVTSAQKAGIHAIATFNRKHFEELGAPLHRF